MIDRDGREMTLICDATGKQYPKTYDSCEFHQMLCDAKGDGWKVVQEQGEWKHYSPESSEAAVEFESLNI